MHRICVGILCVESNLCLTSLYKCFHVCIVVTVQRKYKNVYWLNVTEETAQDQATKFCSQTNNMLDFQKPQYSMWLSRLKYSSQEQQCFHKCEEDQFLINNSLNALLLRTDVFVPPTSYVCIDTYIIEQQNTTFINGKPCRPHAQHTHTLCMFIYYFNLNLSICGNICGSICTLSQTQIMHCYELEIFRLFPRLNVRIKLLILPR